ncbi:dTDP-4-dehydrorhamnose reductase [Falsirhodobacter algicola]|uniref:dTDP-4-dehydrorhamnose reductase n=1 Tax=Falsirhodobacter algicola TaxID=2692330 RepID=A0A8J8SLF1_9RHOB|nr:dTDP-4-dehydrorhamnose reductase [Falsirhodobacter algicola]QUS36417.1 dTDP-4-dehydrorhamnose reductase [Falsirhodobacter algicola]
MILVFGRNGQVARELARLAPKARFLSRAEADLADPAACAAAIRALRPLAVINAAAWTAVDLAETHEAEATVINGAAPAAMAEAAAERDVPMIQISSDYVFDGSGTRAWRPGDAPCPINAYGRSKRAGEVGVAAAGGRHAILRTSWVFGAQGANFVRTMLRIGTPGAHLRVVEDQIGGPTPASDIARACLAMAEGLTLDPGLGGIHHLSGAPDVSWADFARAIFAAAGQKDVTVKGIATADWPTPAARPLNSRLECGTLAQFGLTRPDWRRGLRAMLDDLKEAP